jgi:hypothetical protein
MGSYFPLAVILFFQDIKKEYFNLQFCRSFDILNDCMLPSLSNPILSIGFLCITALGAIFFFVVLNGIDGSNELVVVEAKPIPNDLINYVFPYVVSFMGLDYSEIGKVIGFFIFLAWMFLISYMSGQILMNPLLLAAKWKLYEVEANVMGKSKTLRALSKEQNIKAGQKLGSCLIQGVYVLSRSK